MLQSFLEICKKQPFDEKAFLQGFINLSCPNNVAFDAKIINTPSKVLGIRVPTLRLIAKALKPNLNTVLNCNFWGNYYELQTLRGLLITKLNEPKIVLKHLNNYIPTLDNWASCDLTAGDLKIVASNLQEFEKFIDNSIHDKREFVCRFGVVLLMKYYLNNEYIKSTLQKVETIKNESYYVNMAIGWLICESFLKNKELTYKFLQNTNINSIAVNKGIQKIRESFRVSDTDKQKILRYKR